MDRTVLAEWNPWWAQKPAPKLVERELVKEILPWVKRKEIVGILGVRRCGKTSLLYLLINHLLSTVRPENICFIKCDDERVKKDSLLSDALATYREVINPAGRVFIFIDEIQEVPEWDKTLKRLYDLDPDAKYFISGSNFSVPKEEFSSALAGRIAYFELFPFSFREILTFHSLPAGNAARLASHHEIRHHLLRYLEYGGFPEAVMEPERKRQTQLLQFYFDTIIYRDVIRRKEIRSAAKMENLISFLLQNIANRISYAKAGKLVSLSTDSVSEYMKYLRDAFFLFPLPVFSFSVKKQEINPKKVYCVDTGLRNSRGFRFSDDYGRLMENAVFIELKRRNSASPLSEIYYWTDGAREVDFVVKDGKYIQQLIQVCWNMDDPATKEREIQGLLRAMQELGLRTGTIITESQSGTEKHGRSTIHFVLLWQWLLAQR